MNLVRLIPVANFYGAVLILFLIPNSALSQSDTTKVDTSVNETSPHSLYSGIGFGSNMIYLGSTISRNMPFGYTALTYGFNNEFYATASTVHLSGINPYLAFYSGTLNYNHVFNSWFDLSTGITGYLFTSDSLIRDFIYGDLTLGVDWKLIYTKVSIGGLISDESSIYVQVKNSRFFQTPKFKKDKVYISFDPYINLLFGSLIKTETSNGIIVTNPKSFGRWGTKGHKITSTSYSSTFGISEIDFGLPVAVNFDRMTFEAEASYILPVYQDPEFPAPQGFIIILSFYFKIF